MKRIGGWDLAVLHAFGRLQMARARVYHARKAVARTERGSAQALDQALRDQQVAIDAYESAIKHAQGIRASYGEGE